MSKKLYLTGAELMGICEAAGMKIAAVPDGFDQHEFLISAPVAVRNDQGETERYSLGLFDVNGDNECYPIGEKLPPLNPEPATAPVVMDQRV